MTYPNYYDKPQLLWQAPIFMTNPNYYDSHIYYESHDMVLPNYGHHDCTTVSAKNLRPFGSKIKKRNLSYSSWNIAPIAKFSLYKYKIWRAFEWD